MTHGKTAAARRKLPMSSRVRGILERRWQQAKNSAEGWVWASATEWAYRAIHNEETAPAALKLSGVRPFVLYSLRHTLLTRLGEAGRDACTLARIAGHSSIAISPGTLSQRECGNECVLPNTARKGASRKRKRHAAMKGKKAAAKIAAVRLLLCVASGAPQMAETSSVEELQTQPRSLKCCYFPLPLCLTYTANGWGESSTCPPIA